MASPIWTAVVDIGDKILHSKIQKIFMHVPNVWRYPYLFSLIHKKLFLHDSFYTFPTSGSASKYR